MYSVRHKNDSFHIFCKKNPGNILQENHVIKDNSVIDAVGLNLDLTKDFISDTFKYFICNPSKNFHAVRMQVFHMMYRYSFAL